MRLMKIALVLASFGAMLVIATSAAASTQAYHATFVEVGGLVPGGSCGSATISELAEPFGMSLTGMKKHIRLLEEANLVVTEKIGRARRCTLVPRAFQGITMWLLRLDRFAQVVERTKGAR